MKDAREFTALVASLQSQLHVNLADPKAAAVARRRARNKAARKARRVSRG